MKTLLSLMACIGMGVLLTGCGTVSEVTPTATGNGALVQKYQRVLILDFKDGVSAQAKPKDLNLKKAEMDIATRSFSDRIYIELKARGAFQEVLRSGTPDADTLMISGVITRYEEGSATARLLVGMGAGSSYFDATVDFKDGATSDLLASQKVDKNSWALGGGAAATQTPDAFMREAAKKLAEGLSSLKLTGKLPEKKKGTPEHGAAGPVQGK